MKSKEDQQKWQMWSKITSFKKRGPKKECGIRDESKGKERDLESCTKLVDKQNNSNG